MDSNAELERNLNAVRTGNPEAYRDVIAACELRVRLIIASIVPDREGVDDVAQEVFLKAYQKLSEYIPGTDFPAWINTLARQMAFNARKRSLRRMAMTQRYRVEVLQSCETETGELADVVKAELLDALRVCKDDLDGHARSLTEEFYFHGRSSVELARTHQREEGWVRLVLFRARQALSECLQRKGLLPHG